MTSFVSNTVVQSFMLREKRKVLIGQAYAPAAGPSSPGLVAAVVSDFGSLGFTVSGDVVKGLQGLDYADLGKFHSQLIEVLRDTVGAHVNYRPLFKNFPYDVPESTDYFIRRVFGDIESATGPLTRADYTRLSCGHLINHSVFDLSAFGACPICQFQVPELNGPQAVTVPLAELTPLKILGLATEEDVFKTFDNIVGSRTSLSESYKGFVSAVIGLRSAEALLRLPAAIPFKETAAFVAAALVNNGIAAADLSHLFKTPTDVLRLAAALCGGDASLKEVTRFKLNNGQRQFLLRMLDGLALSDGSMQEEMLGYRGRWLRLGEVLHVGQFQNRFPKAWWAFDALRNREDSITTHAARVEKLMVHSDLKKGLVQAQLLASLSERPGDMARKLDAVLQRGLPLAEVVSTFRGVINAVSTTILLTLLAHFRERAKVAPFRAFMPKGSVAKMYITTGDTRKSLSLATRIAVLALVDEELQRRFKERKALGKVFVDNALESVLVPFSQRSASSGMSPLTRGSRIALDASKEFVRLFMHWSGGGDLGAIDVDLSCALYGEGWVKMDHLSWTNTRSYGNSAHSGDVRSSGGPNGACEFIDLDLAALRRAGVRYAAVMVFSWTGQTFDKFPCFAGFMERENAGNGKQFEAKTVKHKFSVSGPGVTLLPMVLDVKTGQVIWADLSVKGGSRGNSVESMGKLAVAQLKAVDAMQNQRLSLKELFELHGRARGTLVNTREEADLVLDDAQVSNLDEVVSNWL